MELEQAELNRKVKYAAKARRGTGVIFAVDHKATGPWVCVNDTEQRRYVTVRLSQVKPLRSK